jgi:cell division septum initiation protein DivIVA
MTTKNIEQYREEVDKYFDSSPYRQSLIDLGIMNGIPMRLEFVEIYLAACEKRQDEILKLKEENEALKRKVRSAEKEVWLKFDKERGGYISENNKLKEENEALSDMIHHQRQREASAQLEISQLKELMREAGGLVSEANVKYIDDSKVLCEKIEGWLEKAKPFCEVENGL